MTFADKYNNKKDSQPMLMLSITLSLIISFVLSLFTHKLQYLILEVFLLIQTVFIVFNKKSVIKLICKNDNRMQNNSLKNYIYEFFNFSHRFIVYLAIYVVASFIYINRALPSEYESSLAVIGYFRLGMYAFLFINENIRIYLITKKLETETWLPIVDNNLNVIGKVAKSISLETKKRFLHPRLRVMVFYKGRLLLKPIESVTLEKNKYDSPLYCDVNYGEQLPKALIKLLDKYDLASERASFITKYHYENESIKRIIFLYIVHIKDEKVFKDHSAYKTKFWTEKEIRNNINKNILGDFIEQEYELLDSIIYPSIKIMNEDGFDNNTWPNCIGEDITGNDSGISLEN